MAVLGIFLRMVIKKLKLKKIIKIKLEYIDITKKKAQIFKVLKFHFTSFSYFEIVV